MAMLHRSKDCNSISESDKSEMNVFVERKSLTPLPTRSQNSGGALSFVQVTNSQAEASSQSESDEEDFAPDSLMQIEWFHPKMNRSMAAAFLKTHNLEGSYLLRPSDSPRTGNFDLYTLSVWSGGGAFEFPVKFQLENLKLEYGLHAYTIKEFKEHFKKFPRIGKPNLALILKYPMLRFIEEPRHYEVYKPEGFGRTPGTLERFKESIFKVQDSDTSGSYIPIYKAGYLNKRGHIRKNWKKRWFVLDRNELSYYAGLPKNNVESATKLIRRLDLGQVLWVDEKEHKFKQKYCFTLFFPGIKYSMYASEQEDYEAWISGIKRALRLPSYLQPKDSQ